MKRPGSFFWDWNRKDGEAGQMACRLALAENWINDHNILGFT